ncbi:ligand-binding sensor domain-containing protein [Ilyomonas limi]|nr:sensor histidine kinase [Ilyomonas limi]
MILLPCFAVAQQTPFSFRKLGINDGLSQSSVIDIATDSLGFVWFATQDGLNRFDGKEVVVYRKTFDDVTTPVSSRLGKLVCGEDHIIWLISTGGRLEKFNLIREQFEAIHRLGNDSTLLPAVNCIYNDKALLLLGTAQGIYLYHHRTKQLNHITVDTLAEPHLNSNNIQAIHKDHFQHYWLLTDNGITVLDTAGKIIQSFLYSNDPDKTTWISCSAMAQDNEGNYWLGTYGKGVFYKSKEVNSFITFKITGNKQIPQNTVTEAVLADDNGNVWIGTYGDGLYVLNAATHKLQHYTADYNNPFSLSYNDILSIKKDNYGGIWLGTDGGGVNHYDKRFNNFDLLNKSNVPENIAIQQVRSVTTDSSGGLWIGTSNLGLTYTNAARDSFVTFHFPPYQAGLSNYDRIVSLLCDNDGDVWVGTQGNGLLILNHQTQQIKNRFYPGAAAALPDHTIWCMLPHSATQVWIGTRNAGLCLMDKNKGVIKQFTNTGNEGERLPENNVRALVRMDDSTVCIGFDKAGVQLLNTRTFKIINPNIPFGQLAGEQAVLKTLCYQPPYIWIGTLGRGLIAWNEKTNNTYWITEKQGLPNNTIYSIIPEKKGMLWMSTNNGLCSFLPPVNLHHTTASNFSRYTAEDGLQSNEFNTGAHYMSGDSVFYVGGISGLSMFKPSKLLNASLPAKAAITHIQVNNQPMESDTADVYKKILHLSYQQNSLSFSFAALGLVSQSRVHYYYRLLNYGTKWIDAGNRNYAAYTNLPPGSYTMQVKATNNAGNTNAPITELNIIIHPPFWRTWWFAALCTFAVIGLLYALYRYRISQLLHVQQTRNRIASDLHDDIGSTLTNISLLAELSRKKLPPGNEEATLFLKRISEEVQQFSQALDDIVWSINTSNDTLEQTAARMRRYAGEIFEGANINYSLFMDEPFAQHKLNMEQRRDCFLMYKEVINNIYKHANATEVNIRVTMNKNHLNIIIQDNGNGFDTNSITHRNGVKNIRRRAAKWNGTVLIESVKGKGTTVQISMVA